MSLPLSTHQPMLLRPWRELPMASPVCRGSVAMRLAGETAGDMAAAAHRVASVSPSGLPCCTLAERCTCSVPPSLPMTGKNMAVFYINQEVPYGP